MQAKLNKNPLRKRLQHLSPLSLPPQADHVLVELFSSMVAREAVKLPPHKFEALL